MAPLNLDKDTFLGRKRLWVQWMTHHMEWDNHISRPKYVLNAISFIVSLWWLPRPVSYKTARRFPFVSSVLKDGFAAGSASPENASVAVSGVNNSYFYIIYF